MPDVGFVMPAISLVLEILAGRLVAPYVGVSLETYTAIIGVVLAGIAAGHAVGGRLADRPYGPTALGFLIIVGGVSTALTVPVVTSFGGALAEPNVASGVVPSMRYRHERSSRWPSLSVDAMNCSPSLAPNCSAPLRET